MDSVQNMIQNGAFGTSGPMNPNGYNPYQNNSNIIPFGYPVQPQPQQYIPNMYGMPQNNGYVFAPVQQQQPQYNYYNPYGAMNPPMQGPGMVGYGGAYSYNNYNGYSPYPYVTASAIENMRKQQVELIKTKYRIVNGYYGRTVDEDYLDKLCNPDNPVRRKTREQIQAEEENSFMRYVSAVANGSITLPKPQAYIFAESLIEASRRKHEMLDNHSLCQFLEDDLPRFQQQDWEERNLVPFGDRDLSKVYNSNDYNELLKLHNSSNSPYITDLLNTSRYDNNLDDIEVGMKMAFDKERRRRQLLEGKVPTFISSDEVQKRRHMYAQSLLDKIYNKGSDKRV